MPQKIRFGPYRNNTDEVLKIYLNLASMSSCLYDTTLGYPKTVIKQIFQSQTTPEGTWQRRLNYNPVTSLKREAIHNRIPPDPLLIDQCFLKS